MSEGILKAKGGSSLENRMQVFLGSGLHNAWPDGFGNGSTWIKDQWNTIVDIPVGAGVFHGATLGSANYSEAGMMEIRITINDNPSFTASYDAPITDRVKSLHVGLPVVQNSTVGVVSGPEAVRQKIGLPFTKLKVEVKSAIQRHTNDKSFAYYVLDNSPSIIDEPWNTGESV